MRSLRIVVRTASGTLPLVVAASVSSAVACGKSESESETHGNASGGSGGASQGGASSGGANGGTGAIIVVGGSPSTGGGGGVIPTMGGTTSTGGSAGTGTVACTGPGCYTMTIPLPAAGMPVEPGQVCAATLEPVESNRAATVTLRSASDFQMVTGSVTIAPEVTVLGTPTVEVMDATNSALAALQISELAPVAGGGFTFQGTFPEPLPFNNVDEGYERVTLRVTLEAACDGGSKQVHAVTDIHLCMVEGGVGWASSGESCCVCRIIAEMAPSPIVPDKHTDDLPLAQALRLRIVELARVSNTIVLLAENDGGEGLDYEWLPSAGRVEKLDDDVIAWTLEEGTPDPFIQAAVYGKNAAAVASFAFNDRAA